MPPFAENLPLKVIFDFTEFLQKVFKTQVQGLEGIDLDSPRMLRMRFISALLNRPESFLEGQPEVALFSFVSTFFLLKEGDKLKATLNKLDMDPSEEELKLAKKFPLSKEHPSFTPQMESIQTALDKVAGPDRDLYSAITKLQNLGEAQPD